MALERSNKVVEGTRAKVEETERVVPAGYEDKKHLLIEDYKGDLVPSTYDRDGEYTTYILNNLHSDYYLDAEEGTDKYVLVEKGVGVVEFNQATFRKPLEIIHEKVVIKGMYNKHNLVDGKPVTDESQLENESISSSIETMLSLSNDITDIKNSVNENKSPEPDAVELYPVAVPVKEDAVDIPVAAPAKILNFKGEEVQNRNSLSIDTIKKIINENLRYGITLFEKLSGEYKLKKDDKVLDLQLPGNLRDIYEIYDLVVATGVYNRYNFVNFKDIVFIPRYAQPDMFYDVDTDIQGKIYKVELVDNSDIENFDLTDVTNYELRENLNPDINKDPIDDLLESVKDLDNLLKRLDDELIGESRIDIDPDSDRVSFDIATTLNVDGNISKILLYRKSFQRKSKYELVTDYQEIIEGVEEFIRCYIDNGKLTLKDPKVAILYPDGRLSSPLNLEYYILDETNFNTLSKKEYLDNGGFIYTLDGKDFFTANRDDIELYQEHMINFSSYIYKHVLTKDLPTYRERATMEEVTEKIIADYSIFKGNLNLIKEIYELVKDTDSKVILSIKAVADKIVAKLVDENGMDVSDCEGKVYNRLGDIDLHIEATTDLIHWLKSEPCTDEEILGLLPEDIDVSIVQSVSVSVAKGEPIYCIAHDANTTGWLAKSSAIDYVSFILGDLEANVEPTEEDHNHAEEIKEFNEYIERFDITAEATLESHIPNSNLEGSLYLKVLDKKFNKASYAMLKIANRPSVTLAFNGVGPHEYEIVFNFIRLGDIGGLSLEVAEELQASDTVLYTRLESAVTEALQNEVERLVNKKNILIYNDAVDVFSQRFDKGFRYNNDLSDILNPDNIMHNYNNPYPNNRMPDVNKYIQGSNLNAGMPGGTIPGHMRQPDNRRFTDPIFTRNSFGDPVFSGGCNMN